MDDVLRKDHVLDAGREHERGQQRSETAVQGSRPYIDEQRAEHSQHCGRKACGQFIDAQQQDNFP